MNFPRKKLLAAGCAIALLSACATTPDVDPRIAPLERAYENLSSNPTLAPYASDELARAGSALRRVTNPPRGMEDEQFDYAIYAADRLIELAEYAARGRLADDQREALVAEQQDLVLKARTREADQAQGVARQAQAEAAAAIALRERALAEAEQAQKMRDDANRAREEALAKQEMAETAREEALAKQAAAEAAAANAESKADQARLLAQAQAAKAAAAKAEAEAARAEAMAARAEMNSLRNKLSELEARETERGLVLTLGDVLFALNQSELKEGSTRNLKPLVEALQQRPKQQVVIEGHTDSTGSATYNQSLSEKRADSVRDYLVRNGIAAERIQIKGLGQSYPVATNETAEGRQQNRRVEVILPNDENLTAGR